MADPQVVQRAFDDLLARYKDHPLVAAPRAAQASSCDGDGQQQPEPMNGVVASVVAQHPHGELVLQSDDSDAASPLMTELSDQEDSARPAVRLSGKEAEPMIIAAIDRSPSDLLTDSGKTVSETKVELDRHVTAELVYDAAAEPTSSAAVQAVASGDDDSSAASLKQSLQHVLDAAVQAARGKKRSAKSDSRSSAKRAKTTPAAASTSRRPSAGAAKRAKPRSGASRPAALNMGSNEAILAVFGVGMRSKVRTEMVSRGVTSLRCDNCRCKVSLAWHVSGPGSRMLLCSACSQRWNKKATLEMPPKKASRSTIQDQIDALAQGKSIHRLNKGVLQVLEAVSDLSTIVSDDVLADQEEGVDLASVIANALAGSGVTGQEFELPSSTTGKRAKSIGKKDKASKAGKKTRPSKADGGSDDTSAAIADPVAAAAIVDPVVAGATAGGSRQNADAAVLDIKDAGDGSDEDEDEDGDEDGGGDGDDAGAGDGEVADEDDDEDGFVPLPPIS